ncbi:MAG: ATP-binding protein [Acetobacteraceae bacterium]|jgi:signal transduction histidine kinase
MVRLWPKSLAARTAAVVLVGLALVQIAGLTMHTLDRIDVQRLAQARNLGFRIMPIYRLIASTPPDRRAAVLAEQRIPPNFTVRLTDGPVETLLPELPRGAQGLFRIGVNWGVLGDPKLRWTELKLYGGFGTGHILYVFHMPDGGWLDIDATPEPIRPWHSPTFLAAFLFMTLAAAGLTLWAVRRLTEPVRVLAEAAEALGRDVNAPPLPENGPTETAVAAVAFNTMAARIRRFVSDRTEMLTAIGHDLRTPITRLKLRAEFIDDDELRTKVLSDLDELETMVSATLAFGRDARANEPVSSVDLVELLRTILDETSDAHPDSAERLTYYGPPHQTVWVRPVALKRALANLVANAESYGGSARVTMVPPQDGTVSVTIEDDGPGIPPEEIDRVFEPFHRLEQSRNRETGGVGLGLPIARNMLRAHGGDVVLKNRPEGGLKAIVTLPV